jgi:hypothetical protein
VGNHSSHLVIDMYVCVVYCSERNAIVNYTLFRVDTALILAKISLTQHCIALLAIYSYGE